LFIPKKRKRILVLFYINHINVIRTFISVAPNLTISVAVPPSKILNCASISGTNVQLCTLREYSKPVKAYEDVRIAFHEFASGS